MRSIFLLLVAIATLSTSVPSQKAYDDAEAYAVYSALIQSYVSEMGEYGKRPALNLVITPETTDYPKFGGEAYTIEKCVANVSKYEAFAAMIGNYKTANKTPVLLQAKFDLPYKYQFFSRADRDALFQTKGVNGWKAFDEKYPGAPGIMSMSAVGFSPEKTLAVVYFARGCGWLCADGTYYVLKKENGKWVSKGGSSQCMWVS